MAEIAKLIVVREKESGQPRKIVASGDNRHGKENTAGFLDEKLVRAHVPFVRDSTGFVIGGSNALDHANPIRPFRDTDLRRFNTAREGARTPFSICPSRLQNLARITDTDWSDPHLKVPNGYPK